MNKIIIIRKQKAQQSGDLKPASQSFALHHQHIVSSHRIKFEANGYSFTAAISDRLGGAIETIETLLERHLAAIWIRNTPTARETTNK